MFLTKNRRTLAAIAALALTCSGLAVANGYQHIRWNSPGAVGIPSTGYEDDIRAVGSAMTMQSTSGTFAKVLYPVNANSIFNPDLIALSARYRDTGTYNRVKVYLKERRHDTGIVFTRLFLDSNTKPASSSPQIMIDSSAYSGWGFQSANSVFFVEVHLYKTGSSLPYLYSLTVEGDMN